MVVGGVGKKRQGARCFKVETTAAAAVSFGENHVSTSVWAAGKLGIGTKADYWIQMQEKLWCACVLMPVQFVGEKTKAKKRKSAFFLVWIPEFEC